MAFVNLLTMILSIWLKKIRSTLKLIQPKLLPSCMSLTIMIFRNFQSQSPKSTKVNTNSYKWTHVDTFIFAPFSSAIVMPRLKISPTKYGGHIVPAAKVGWALFNNRCGYSINSFDGLTTTFYNKHCYYLKCGHFGNIFWVIFFSEIESTFLFC